MKNCFGFFFAFYVISFSAFAQDCLPIQQNYQNYTCEGNYVVKSFAELQSYLNNYGFKKNKIKNLHINFDLNQNSDLQISTPCQVVINENKKIQANNVCIHGGLGVEIQAFSIVNVKNFTLESFDEAIIRHDNKLIVDDLKIKSYGVNSFSKVRLGFNSFVQARNILLDSFDYSSIGSNSIIKVQNKFEMFSRGDLDSVIGSKSLVEANIINISARDELKIGSGVKLKANEVTLNSEICDYKTSGVSIDSPNKTGNCFLTSNPKGYLVIDKNSGEVPLEVNFNFSVPGAIKYLLDFGDGQQVETSENMATYIYHSIGDYTAKLRYATEVKKNGKYTFKNGGVLQISVKPKQNLPPIADLNCSSSDLLVTCNAISSYDPEGFPLQYSFIYTDSLGSQFVDTNTSGLSSFAFLDEGNVNIRLIITDHLGLQSEVLSFLTLVEKKNIMPVAKISCLSDGPFQVVCDGLQSSDEDGLILSYKFSLEDGQNIVQSTGEQIRLKSGITGEQKVFLTITDDKGGVGTSEFLLNVLINNNPIAQFSCEPNFEPLKIKCLSSSKDNDLRDSISKTSWYLNDQLESSNTGEIVLYAQPGENRVKIEVEDLYGGITLLEKTFTVLDLKAPTLLFQYINGYEFDSNSIQQFYIEIDDSDAINMSRFELFINDLNVPSSFYSLLNNRINVVFAENTYLKRGDNLVRALYSDTNGNLVEQTVTYKIIDNLPPEITITPSSGTNFTGHNGNITIWFNKYYDDIDWSSLEILHGEDQLDPKVIVRDQNKITLNVGSGEVLEPGINNFQVKIKDLLGNSNQQSFSYNFEQSNLRFDFIPQNNTTLQNANDLVSIYLVDEESINWQSVKVYLDERLLNSSEYTLVLAENKVTVPLNILNSTQILKIEATDNLNRLIKGESVYKLRDYLAPDVTFNISNMARFENNLRPMIVAFFSDNSQIDFNSLNVELNEVKIPSDNLFINYENKSIQIKYGSMYLPKIGRNQLIVKVSDEFGNEKVSNLDFDILDTEGPRVQYNPYAEASFYSNNLQVSATVSDLSIINWSTFRASLNNVPIPLINYFKVEDTIIFTFDEYFSFELGKNAISIYVEDIFGNPLQNTSNFNLLENRPSLFNFYPERNARIKSESTEILAVANYPDEINRSSIKVTINGVEIDNSYFTFDENILRILIGSSVKFKQGLNNVKIDYAKLSGELVSDQVTYILEDIFSPELAFNIADGSVFKNQDVNLGFSVFDLSSLKLSSLEVVHNGLRVDSSKISFDGKNGIAKLKLAQNLNEFVFKISDTKGNVGTKGISLHLGDISGPLYAFTPQSWTEFGSNEDIKFQVKLSDYSGIDFNSVRIYWNENDLDVTNYFVNQQSGIIDVKIANSDNYNIGQNNFKISAIDSEGNYSERNIVYKVTDKTSPQIIETPSSEFQFENALSPNINVQIIDKSNINKVESSLKLNGKLLLRELDYFYSSDGKTISIAPVTSLLIGGDNYLDLKIIDAFGNSAEKSIVYNVKDTLSPIIIPKFANGTIFSGRSQVLTFEVKDQSEIIKENIKLYLNELEVENSKIIYDSKVIAIPVGEDLLLKTGSNSIRLNIRDQFSNEIDVSFNYEMLDVYASVIDFIPQNGSTVNNLLSSEITVHDDSEIRWDKTKIYINGLLIPESGFDNQGNKIILNPEGVYRFRKGINEVSITVEDSKGNITNASSIFKNDFISQDLLPPQILMSPSNVRIEQIPSEFVFELSDSSGVELRSFKVLLNGIEISEENFEFDYERSRVYLKSTSSLNLTQGRNIFTVFLQDKILNHKIKAFYIDLLETASTSDYPVITFNPKGGEVVSVNPMIEVFLSDKDGIDFNSIQVYLNENLLDQSLIQKIPEIGKVIVQLDEQNKLNNTDSNVLKVAASDRLGNRREASVGFDHIDSLKYEVVAIGSGISAFGSYFNCALLDSQNVRCWGVNDYGRIGVGSNSTSLTMTSPPAVVPLISSPEPVKKVVVGANHSCLLTEPGNVLCWGYNGNGQLGFGHTNVIGDNELPISQGFVNVGSEVKDLALGFSHTCALLKDGNVKCWGENIQGQLGYSTSSNFGDDELPSSMNSIFLGEKAVQLTAGKQYTCALLESGNVKCFGEAWGLGLKTSQNSLGKNLETQPNIQLNGKAIKVVASSQNRVTCAILESGDMNCWGQTYSYALGYQGVSGVGVAQHPKDVGIVPLNNVKVKSVSVGYDHTCAILEPSELRCWGSGTHLQNGTNTTIGDNEQIMSVPAIDYGNDNLYDVAAGFRATCLLYENGGMKCWGHDNLGSLGQAQSGVSIPASSLPTLPFINLGEDVFTANKITAFFEADNYYGVSPYTINLDASKSKSIVSNIVNYRWDMGDGNVFNATTSNFTHVYQNNGVYKIILTVSDSSENTDIFHRTVTVGDLNNPPNAFFEANIEYGVSPLNVHFDGSGSFDVNGSIANYSWEFGDSETVSSQVATITHEYINPGVYFPVLKVTDNEGVSSTSLPLSIVVKETNISPFVNFDCFNNGLDLECSAFKSWDFDGRIQNYSWEISDGSIANSSLSYKMKHRFLGDGNYQITLKVQDENGSVSQKTIDYVIDTIKPNLIFNISQNELTNNGSFPVSILVDEIHDANTEIFNNGNLIFNSNEKVLVHNLSLVEGVNNISVVSTDSFGNRASNIIAANLVYDKTSPSILSINPISNSETRELSNLITGQFSEKISSLYIDDEEVQVKEDGSFSFEHKAMSEGVQQISFVFSDLAGNTSMYTHQLNLRLKILYPELIILAKNQNNKVLVKGLAGSVKPNSSFKISAGFLNTVEGVSNSNGEFEVELNYFDTAKITVIDDLNSLEESAVLNYEVNTTLSGVIRDVDESPIPGVRITVKGSDVAPVLTNEAGLFSIPNPPTGDQVLIIDGHEVSPDVVGPNKKYSSLEIQVSVGSRQANAIEKIIYLAPLYYDGTETIIENGVATTVESENVNGVKIEIPSNVNVDFPEGNTLNAINFIEVDKTKTTVPVPSAVEPDSVVALEPSGLEFSEPVDLTLPNTNEFPAGMQLAIYSKNSKTGQWEVDGLAKVTDDGQSIQTEEGQGITHFSEVYAAPMGLKFSQLNSQDKPGADTFNGAVSTAIDFPSYKAFNQDFAPQLIYRSNWAYPTATVTNIFDIPNDMTMINFEGKRIVVPSKNDLGYIKTWVVPDKINMSIIAGDYRSPVMTVSGIPYKSVVSMGLDLKNQSSGILPFSADYEIHLKRMVIRTELKGKPNIFQQEIRVNELPPEVSSEMIPSSLTGNLYVQNKVNSSIGRGWMVGGVQRIVNPRSNRLMIEEENGSVSTYVVNDRIQTLSKESIAFSNISTDGDDLIISTGNSSQKVFNLNLDTGSKADLLSLNAKSGIFKSNLLVGRYECSAWTKVFGKRVCFAYKTRFYCQQKESNYTLKSERKYVVKNPKGSGYIVAEEGGAIYLHDGNESLFAGSLKTAPNLENDLFFCSSSASCSNERTTADFRSPNCWSSGPSTGQIIDKGDSAGSLLSSKFNTIKSIVNNPVSNGIAIADFGNNKVKYLNLDTNEVSVIAGNGRIEDSGDGGLATSAGVFHPSGLAYDANGNLYISSEKGYIRKVDRNGIISTIAGNPFGVYYEEATAKDMYLKRPYGLVVDNNKGLLYVADTGNNRVLRIDLATGIAKNIAGNGLCQRETPDTENGAALGASMCSPETLAIESSGNLIIGDTGHNLIRRVVFSDSQNGQLKFDPIVADNSSLIRNSNGTYTRTLRSGVKFEFDQEGKHIRTLDRIGNSRINHYDSSNRVIAQVDPSGNQIFYNYGALGKLSSISYGVDGRVFNLDHDFNGNLSQVNYPDGTSRRFEYDENGLLNKEIDARDNAVTYVYNEWKRLKDIVRPDGKKVTINDSQSVSMINNYTGGTKGTLKKQGTGQNELADGIKDAKGITTQMVSDESGYVSTIIDGDGRVTKVERDLKGRPVIITRPDNSTVSFEYDQNTGDLLTKEDSLSDSHESFEYDTYGNLLSQTNTQGRRILNEYDSRGLLIRTTNELTGTGVTYVYNSKGLLQSQTDSLGNTSSVIYDSRFNLIKSIAPNNIETNFILNSSGHANQVIDGKSNITKYDYDDMNRLISVTTAKGEKTLYTYLETGELSQTIDPNEKEVNYFYDNLGQLIKKIGTRGETTELSYDANGNLAQEITPKGEVKTFAYDNLDQLISKTLPDNQYVYEYDIRGNIESVRNNVSKIDFEYAHFERGDMISKVHSYGIGDRTDLPNNVLNYSYNSSAERVLMETVKGAFSYQRDSAGRLRQIINHKGESFSFKYDLNQRLKEVSSPVSITSFSFDTTGFNTQIEHKKKSGALIDRVIYGRDAIGNRVSRTNGDGVASFTYDKNSQLLTASIPKLPNENYSYDEIGNRTSDHKSSYRYDITKQFLEEDYKYLYTFDVNGNLTSKQEKGLVGNYENYDYNSENQLMRYTRYVENNLVIDARYVYDVLGRRIEKRVINNEDPNLSTIRRFAYDGNEILFEYNGQNTITHTYTHSTLRTDDILSVATSSDSFFYTKDGLGSITEVLNEEGGVVQSYKYSSFGEILKIENAFGEDITSAPIIKPFFTYTGREYDSESGLYYYRARYYDSAIGRFLQVDPDAGRLLNPITHVNRYAYVGSNPHNLIDPSGMISVNSAITLGSYIVSSSPLVAGIARLAKKDPKLLIRGAVATAAIGGALATGAWVPVVVGAVVGAGVGWATGGKTANAALKGAFLGAIGGGVAGIAAVATTGVTMGLGMSLLYGAGVSGVGTAAATYAVSGHVDWKAVSVAAVTGGVFGMVANGIKGDTWHSMFAKGAVDANNSAASGVGEEAVRGSRGSNGGQTFKPSYP